jgi:Domain of unknown function (DUF4173)/Calcineurin-like phosphoesterase
MNTEPVNRLAVITDVHGNMPALEAALRRIAELHVAGTYCGGDLVDYGPRPNEVCRVIVGRARLCLTEAAALRGRVRTHPLAAGRGGGNALARRPLCAPHCGGPARARRRFAPAAIVGSAVALLALSLANPDGLIAERNVQRWRASGRLDVRYLQMLSADAAPAISELPLALERAALEPLAERLAAGDPWSSLNVSRRRAREIVAGG